MESTLQTDAHTNQGGLPPPRETDPQPTPGTGPEFHTRTQEERRRQALEKRMAGETANPRSGEDGHLIPVGSSEDETQ